MEVVIAAWLKPNKVAERRRLAAPCCFLLLIFPIKPLLVPKYLLQSFPLNSERNWRMLLPFGFRRLPKINLRFSARASENLRSTR